MSTEQKKEVAKSKEKGERTVNENTGKIYHICVQGNARESEYLTVRNIWYRVLDYKVEKRKCNDYKMETDNRNS